MNPWFRMHHEVLDDPKVQCLDPRDFKSWVNLLCLAARHDGKLPALSHVAFALRIDERACNAVIDRLVDAGLIDRRSGGVGGSYYAPHAWDKRQYKSDGSTERVKRFRERSKTVSATGPDTDTDTEAQADRPIDKSIGAIAIPTNPLKAIFDNGVASLAKSGVREKQARSIIGKWRRDYGDGAVVEALTDCTIKGVTNPVEWMTKALAERSTRKLCKNGDAPIEATAPLL